MSRGTGSFEPTHNVLQLLDETTAVALNEITIKLSRNTMFGLQCRSETSKIIPTSYSLVRKSNYNGHVAQICHE